MSDQGGGSQSLDDFENEAPLHLVPRRVITADGSSQNNDQVIGESPVALVFNGISHAVMMATPADLEDFIVGFALCEGLIGRRSDIVDIELRPTKMGLEVDATTTNRVAESMRARRRSMMGPSGCGICIVLSSLYRRLTESCLRSRRGQRLAWLPLSAPVINLLIIKPMLVSPRARMRRLGEPDQMATSSACERMLADTMPWIN